MTLKHYWQFNEGAGTTATDAIGHETISIDQASWQPGRTGSSLRLDSGNGARVATTSLLSNELGAPWTVSMWIQREADSESATLLSSDDAAIRLEQWQNTHAVGITKFGSFDWSSGYQTRVGAWVHVVLVGTGSDTRIYIDGKQLPRIAPAINLPLQWIGSTRGYGEVGSFLLDELKVYDEALTAAQVLELYGEIDRGDQESRLRQVWSWGFNDFGQLGDGTNSQRTLPTRVPYLATGTTRAIAAGGAHCMALLEDGTVWAWGHNGAGELGDSTLNDRYAPVQVLHIARFGVKALSGGGGHSLALLGNGRVWAWGRNSSGEVGTGSAAPDKHSIPVEVVDLGGVKAIGAGGVHSLALLEDGTVRTWGSNSHGQLGNGTNTSSARPVTVSGLSRVKAITAGDQHTLALLEDGTVWAWGNNSRGQLGDGPLSARYTPVLVSGLTGAKAIGAGTWHSVALLEDGTVWAWGHNDQGQLGNGTNTQSARPVQVSGLTGVKAISTSNARSLALLGDGTVWAWGYNIYGQIGNGTTTDSNRPVQVSGLTGIKAIAAGAFHSLAAG